MWGRVRELAGRIWREHTTPRRLGAAVAVGILVGCSPFFGLHFWIGLGLSFLFRLNKVAVLLGSQVSIPPLAPFLGFASVQVGALLLSGETVELTVDDFAVNNLPELLRHFLLNWIVGGIVVGAGLALPGFALTSVVVRRRREQEAAEQADAAANEDAENEGAENEGAENVGAENEGAENVGAENVGAENVGAENVGAENVGAENESSEDAAWEALVQRATARFAEARRGHRIYARMKYRMDPLYREVSTIIGTADRVVDIGTGLGMLPIVLALGRPGREVVGIDWDADKIASGQQACADLQGVTLQEADMREYAIPACDTVVLADVLHYWPLEVQRDLLDRAADALAPGGRLIIRETDREARSALTRLLEGIAVRVGWNKGPGLTYRTGQELQEELEQRGLACASTAASSSVHKGNILVWGEKPAAGAER
jgi:uncharacterized protein (DUF2062 family)/SAM-dependent methyltransferase